MKVTVCVLFNHPYPKNIPLLHDLLKPRFKNILFVQPLVRSDRPDVLTTFRGSYNFQGMLTDALARLRDMESDYVVFVQDDCLLNPLLNEDNIVSELQVSEDVPYLPEFTPLAGAIDEWYWTLPIVWKLVCGQSPLIGTGVENVLTYFPNAEDAKTHLQQRYGFVFNPITRTDQVKRTYRALPDAGLDHELTAIVAKGLFGKADNTEMALSFPWLLGASDFCVMSIQSLEKVADFLGISAAANIFVEIALPSALAIYHNTVSNAATTGWQAKYVWDSERNELTKDEVIGAFARRCAVVHPIKLSIQHAMAEEILRL